MQRLRGRRAGRTDRYRRTLSRSVCGRGLQLELSGCGRGRHHLTRPRLAASGHARRVGTRSAGIMRCRKPSPVALFSRTKWEGGCISALGDIRSSVGRLAVIARLGTTVAACCPFRKSLPGDVAAPELSQHGDGAVLECLRTRTAGTESRCEADRTSCTDDSTLGDGDDLEDCLGIRI